jgi:ATP/maltotriose-dependent transcriptional regulator MalT
MVTSTLFDELMVAILPYQADQRQTRQRAEAELSEALASLDDVFHQRSARSAAVVLRVLRGEWVEAFALFEQSNLRSSRLVIPTIMAPLARHRGDAALAWSLVRDALHAGPDTDPENSAGYILPLRTLAVTLSLDAGDLDVAQQWLAALDRWLEWSGSVLGQADAHVCWAAYEQALGDPAQARVRATQALAAASDPRQPLVLLAAHRLLGELDLAEGRLDDAEAHLVTSLALADACDARHEQALTLLVLADVLRARGAIAAARTQLETVRQLCTPIGAAVALAQADVLEARLPARQATPPATLPAGLTAREAEVLRLLATGMTNAEIARELSLSPRTIDAHLTTIYSKLDVATRGAAIRYALDHDLS